MLELERPLTYKRFTYIVLALAGTILFLSCKTNIEEIQKLAEREELPSMITYNSEIVYTENGTIKIRVLSPESYYYQHAEEPYNEFEKGITVFSYNDSLEVESKLTANYAIFYEKKKLWVARYDVVVVNSKGETLNTERLFWNQEEKRIYTRDMVVITQGEDVLVGEEGMESDETFENWELIKPRGSVTFEQD